MGFSIGLRIKPLDAGILMLHIESERRAAEHNSSTQSCYVVVAFMSQVKPCTIAPTSKNHHPENTRLHGLEFIMESIQICRISRSKG